MKKSSYRKVDSALWQFVREMCWHYSDHYGLRLKSIRPLTISESKDYRGLCFRNGTLAFDLRGIEPYRVIEIVAHELAHLAHFEHESNFLRLHSEIVLKMVENGEFDKVCKVCNVLPT